MKTKTPMTILALAAAAIMTCRGAAERQTISLAGQWRFEIAGTNAEAFKSQLPGTIHLPGTMDDAGLGPRNTNAPTLEGPYRLYNYAGPAWYQKEIEIPARWKDQRVTLFLERARWVTRVWLDDRFIGTQDSLIAPHVYDFGTGVAPGKHRLTVCVDNTVKIDLGRFVSALFGGTWGNMNGVIGRIELNAAPPVWIDDLEVYPRLATGVVTVKGRIGNATGEAGAGTMGLQLSRPGRDAVPGVPISNSTPHGPPHELNVTWDAGGGSFAADLPIAEAGPIHEWDEFSPNLYELHAVLNKGAQVKAVRFGYREFAAKGTQFAMNGRPVFLRGTLECSIFPKTGYPPTRTADWQKIFKTIKSYGLNFMRFHSWCPPEAAFAAADLEGVMLQVEGPQANVPAGSDPARDAFIEAEFKRMVDTYGNHPSFCLMTLGNEYGGKEALLTRWVDMLIQRDPRHLYSSASAAQTTPNRQWTERTTGRGIHGPGTERDLREVVASEPRPIVGHEIGQWMFFPDFRKIKKWTGVMALKNFEAIRQDMEKKHLLELAPEFVQASGPFAVSLYKEEIEALLRTPGYGGFSLLDLHDYPTQGTALVGPLDAFWDSKGFVSPEGFRRFCGPTVPLLRLSKRTYTVDESLSATADLAHYGPTALSNVVAAWTIKDARGHIVAANKWLVPSVPTGGLTHLGTLQASLAQVAAPAKLSVSIELERTPFRNDWDIWVYPANTHPQPPADLVVCDQWDAAKAALARRKRVLYFAFATRSAESLRGRFTPVFWSPVWFPTQKPNTMGLLCNPRHPLFAQFPTDVHSDWQWYELMQNSRIFVLDQTPVAYRPELQVIDNFARNHKLGVIFEGRVGGGQLLVCGFERAVLSQDPAGRQLLAGLYAYADSPAFKPAQELSDALLDQLFVPHYSNKLQQLGAKISADSAEPDYPAENAMDGDPDTMWHTPWGDEATQFPHSLILEFPEPTVLHGLSCLPRQDNQRNGWIKNYAVYVSADGKSWGAPIAEGAFKRDGNLHTIRFREAVTTRFVKLVASSSFDPTQPFASLAEISIVTE